VIAIRSLAGVGWDQLAAGFNQGFRDYLVPVAMTPAALESMQRRRGYAAACSFGAYDGDRMIGLILTCLDGDRAYNSGTGVAPEYRGGGVARRLLDAVIAAVPARTYLLEVIEANQRAAAVYRAAGFAETRRFDCWTYGGDGDATAPQIAAPDLDALVAAGDIEPSWQNSAASIRRAPEPYLALGDEHGAAVVFPDSADLALLAVPRAARRRGRGARLLAAAAARCTRPLRILNVDDRAPHLAAFLRAVGAAPLLRQIEMIREVR